MLVDKIEEDFNFLKHAEYDVSEILKFSTTITEEEWNSDKTRQNSYKLLSNTNSFFFYQTGRDWDPATPHIVEKRNYHETVEEIVSDLEKIHNGVRGKVLLTRLNANQNIGKHQDAGPYLSFVRRHHIPIITSKSTTFTVAGETIVMQPGECWEINNSKAHYVTNNSDIARIHLLIDIMPFSKIQNGYQIV
jgi:hypothetical protein